MSNFFVGTSGWNYAHWAEGVFYPRGLRENKWLEYYSGFFNAVELNVTFYRLVQKKIFENWNKRTPIGFHFAVKGSRFITHIKKLNYVEDSLDLFLHNVSGLKEKLSAILWQLPPGLKKNSNKLELFLNLLKKSKTRQVFEFRNQSWFDPEIYELLKKHNVSLCIAHSKNFPCVREITADFLYLRFHGAGLLYGSDYQESELKEWADFAKDYKNKDIFAFFNNDAYGYAIKNAKTFRELLEKGR